MPHSVSGGGKAAGPSYKIQEKKLTKALVVEDVQIIEKTIEVPIYRLVDIPKEQVKYVTKEEEQVRYTTKEKETVKYKACEENTVKYVVREEQTTKYIPVEVGVKVERPIVVLKEYEQPVIKEKIYEVVSYGDAKAIKELKDMVPGLIADVKSLKKELDGLKKYKLVEELVKVPIIEWVSTPVERIVWKDVTRERPK